MLRGRCRPECRIYDAHISPDNEPGGFVRGSLVNTAGAECPAGLSCIGWKYRHDERSEQR